MNQSFIEIINNKNLRILGNTLEPWFLARDIAECLGYKNSQKAIRDHVGEKDKITYKIYKNKYGIVNIRIQEETILLNKNGLISFLTCCKKCDESFLRLLKDKFNLDYNIIKRLSKEEEFISIILKTFKGLEMIRQYKVLSYRLDLYFPKYNLIVECDEFGHSDRDVEYEKKRTDNIVAELKDPIFIRFNPDEKNFTIFEVLNQIFLKIHNF